MTHFCDIFFDRSPKKSKTVGVQPFDPNRPCHFRCFQSLEEKRGYGRWYTRIAVNFAGSAIYSLAQPPSIVVTTSGASEWLRSPPSPVIPSGRGDVDRVSMGILRKDVPAMQRLTEAARIASFRVKFDRQHQPTPLHFTVCMGPDTSSDHRGSARRERPCSRSSLLDMLARGCLPEQPHANIASWAPPTDRVHD